MYIFGWYDIYGIVDNLGIGGNVGCIGFCYSFFFYFCVVEGFYYICKVV